MKVRNVVCVVFIDRNLNIIVQERGNHAKVGEKYGFWGGKIEEGETPQQAIIREIKEELGYSPKKFVYLGKYPYVIQEEGKYKGWAINQHVFASPITPGLDSIKTHEGKGSLKMRVDEVVGGKGFAKGSTTFLEKLKGKLRKLF